MNLNNTTIATVDDLRKATSISDQIEDTVLQPYLLIAEKKHLYDILGTPFVTYIKEQMTGITATTELSIELQNLLEYSNLVSVYGAWYEYLPFSNVQTTVHGEVTKTSDSSTPASDRGQDVKRKALLSTLNLYQKDLQTFLDSMKSVYEPMGYRTCQSNNNFNDSTGFYLGIY